MTTDAILTRFDNLNTWRQGDQRPAQAAAGSVCMRWAGGYASCLQMLLSFSLANPSDPIDAGLSLRYDSRA